MGRWLMRAMTTAGAIAIAVVGFAAAAQAHVTVNPNTASPGTVARIDFRVPTESDTASTTKLAVFLPTEQPLASVLVMPVPGWTAALTTTNLVKPVTTDDGDEVTKAISEITWTADSPATAIKPGEFLEFPVSLGPLPAAATMSFKAVQTYSDGSVVEWTEPTVAGRAEPEHPAPVLHIAAPVAAATAPNKTAPNNQGLWIVAVVGVVLGVVGTVFGINGYVRGRARR
jgi:uncharacterized protein YcnI